MTTVQEVLEAAKHLSPVEQLEVIRALSGSLQSHYANHGEQPTRVLLIQMRSSGRRSGF